MSDTSDPQPARQYTAGYLADPFGLTLQQARKKKGDGTLWVPSSPVTPLPTSPENLHVIQGHCYSFSHPR